MTIDPITIQGLRELYDTLRNPQYGDHDWAWVQIGLTRAVLADLLRQIDGQSQDER